MRFVLTALLLVLLSCNSTPEAGNREQKDADSGRSGPDTTNWPGTYRSILPCEDCRGIDTRITLHRDMTFTLKIRHQGGAGQQLQIGGYFHWTQPANQLELEGLDTAVFATLYALEPGYLIQLGNDGKYPENELYRLEKLALP